MGKPSPASRRAALAAQREAEVRAARRTRLISVALGGILALALVIGLGVWWNQKNKPAPTSTVTTTGAQLAAPSATPCSSRCRHSAVSSPNRSISGAASTMQ